MAKRDIRLWLEKMKKGAEKALEESAEYGLALAKERILEGKNTDNAKMRTKSKKRFGVYSKDYGKSRKRAGVGVSTFDLKVTGKLLENFAVSRRIRRTKNTQDVNLFVRKVKAKRKGDTTRTYKEIADYLEAYQGSIFTLSRAEQNKVVKEYNKIFRRETK